MRSLARHSSNYLNRYLVKCWSADWLCICKVYSCIPDRYLVNQPFSSVLGLTHERETCQSFGLITASLPQSFRQPSRRRNFLVCGLAAPNLSERPALPAPNRNRTRDCAMSPATRLQSIIFSTGSLSTLKPSCGSALTCPKFHFGNR